MSITDRRLGEGRVALGGFLSAFGLGMELRNTWHKPRPRRPPDLERIDAAAAKRARKAERRRAEAEGWRPQTWRRLP